MNEHIQTWRQQAQAREIKTLQIASLNDLGTTTLEILRNLQHFGTYGVRVNSAADPLLRDVKPKDLQVLATAVLNARRLVYIMRVARMREAGIHVGRRKGVRNKASKPLPPETEQK